LMIILAEDIIILLFGYKWLSIKLPFQILASGLVFRTSYKISDALVNAVGAVYKRALIKWIYATLVVLLAIIGHNQGITGVAFVVLIAIVINYLLMAILSLKLINLKLRQFVKVHLGAILLSAFTLLLIPFNKIDFINNLNSFIAIFINVLFYIFIIMLPTMIKLKFFIGNVGDNYIKKIFKTRR